MEGDGGDGEVDVVAGVKRVAARGKESTAAGMVSCSSVADIVVEVGWTDELCEGLGDLRRYCRRNGECGYCNAQNYRGSEVPS